MRPPPRLVDRPHIPRSPSLMPSRRLLDVRQHPGEPLERVLLECRMECEEPRHDLIDVVIHAGLSAGHWESCALGQGASIEYDAVDEPPGY